MSETPLLCACGCGNPVKVRRYPSQSQARFLQGHQHKGADNGNYRGGKVKLTCPVCGVAFLEFPAHAPRRVTCASPACYSKWQSLTTSARGQRKITVPCGNCGGPVRRYPSLMNEGRGWVFCSKACTDAKGDRRAGSNASNWRGGKRNFVRKTAYARDQGRCVICGFSLVSDVHHITPRSEGGTDALGNLVTLCPNHHRLVHAGIISVESYRRSDEDGMPTPVHALASH